MLTKKDFNSLFVLIISVNFLNAQKDVVNTVADELRKLHDISLLPKYEYDSKSGMQSSYDPTGGNDDGFNGTYSFIRKENGHSVLTDLKGPGVVTRIFTPTPTTKMVSFYFDGEKEPRLRLPFIDLFSGTVFPFERPIVGNEIGGYYNYFPITYNKSLKIVYEGDDIRFHQIQYRTYQKEHVTKTFDLNLSKDARAEMDKIKEIFDSAEMGIRVLNFPQQKSLEKNFEIKPGESKQLIDLQSPGRIVGIEIQRNQENWDRSILFKINQDGEGLPSVYCPINDYFGYFFGNPSARGLLLGSVNGTDYSYYPMPFDSNLSVTLISSEGAKNSISGKIKVTYVEGERNKKEEGKFYALWSREEPKIGEPYLLIDQKGKGHHVGTILQAQGLVEGTSIFFEGDDMAITDGELRLHGTGSEDYFNGGWYWVLDRWDAGVSNPLHGCLGYSMPNVRTGGYRFLMSDKVSFDKSYQFTMEHGPEGNKAPVDYTSMVFYYGDTPPKNLLDPTSFKFDAKPPKKHVYGVRDYKINLGPGTSVHSPGNHIVIKVDSQNPLGVFFSADSTVQGKIRIDLDEMRPGRYNVFLSYKKDRESGMFSLWRRQQQLTSWIDAHSEEPEDITFEHMGELAITEDVRSLTIQTKEQGDRNTVQIGWLILEEID